MHLCFWCPFPRRPAHPTPCWEWPWPLPRPRCLPREYWAAPVDASPISFILVVPSAYSWIASIHCFAVGAGIRFSRIWMVFSYVLDRLVKICLFMASSVILSVVLISFLHKAINLVKYWVTVSSGDGREAVNFRRTWVRLSFVAALSSRSLSASHIPRGSLISSMSGRSWSQHPRCIRASALLARSCQLSFRGCGATPLPTGRSSTPVTIL